jgi:hypothetical protein
VSPQITRRSASMGRLSLSGAYEFNKLAHGRREAVTRYELFKQIAAERLNRTFAEFLLEFLDQSFG